MRAFLAIFDRELRAYFLSPIAYVILTFFLIGNGVVFAIIVSYLNDPRFQQRITPFQLFFDSFFYWLVLIVVTPILTMRLISEELKTGTIEPLMTAPVSEGQVVVAKYLASLTFYVFLWLPTLAYGLIVSRGGSLDWGPVLGGYVGVLGMGAMFLAVGIFGSTFSKNQIVAAMGTFAMVFVVFVLTFLENLVNGETAKTVLGHMNLLAHMEDFSKGVIDTRHLVYYATTAALFLFFTSRSLAAKKWR
jgi:gliding motility-associated transport system permease protein